MVEENHKGEWCPYSNKKPLDGMPAAGVFCQEGICSGCQIYRNRATGGEMFKAIVEAHNLNAIETDPVKVATMEAETISELTEEVSVAVCGQAPLFSQGYCITVSFSRKAGK
jgi:hypothetical protein